MKISLLILISFFTSAAWAFPEAPFDALASKNLKNLSSYEALQYDFEGIVKLSNCSGSLITFAGMPETAKAVVMTNGHCVGSWGRFPSPGEAWVNKRESRSMRLYDRNMKLHRIRSVKMLYATMTNTDLAFLELDETYAEIKARTNVRPLLLDTTRPFLGQEIEVISGYWDRGWSCSIDGFAFKLQEGNWFFTDSIRYTNTCDTMGGTSGSPITAKGERRAIGVNNSANESGKRCVMNNPCEIDEQGEITVKAGYRYGQQTYNVYNCLTPDFRLDLDLSQCDLPK